MMRTPLPAGPDPGLTDRYGGTALIPAAERGHVAYVRAVLDETDIDVDHVNRLGWTALLEAVIPGSGARPHQEVVALLLAAEGTRGSRTPTAARPWTTPSVTASRRSPRSSREPSEREDHGEPGSRPAAGPLPPAPTPAPARDLG